MTNRERIMTELAGMNDQDLHNALTNDNDSRLIPNDTEERSDGDCPYYGLI